MNVEGVTRLDFITPTETAARWQTLMKTRSRDYPGGGASSGRAAFCAVGGSSRPHEEYEQNSKNPIGVHNFRYVFQEFGTDEKN
jgi:hypothetical protein